MLKYVHKSEYGNQKVVVQADAETTLEAFSLWCQFMRGVSFYIDDETEQEMVEALANQRSRILSARIKETEDEEDLEEGSETDVLESAAEKY